MLRELTAILLAAVMLTAQLCRAELASPSQYLVIVASRPTLDEIRDIATEFGARFPGGLVLQSANGQYAVSIGAVSRAEGRQTLDRLIAEGKIPPDSFLTSGTKYAVVETPQPTPGSGRSRDASIQRDREKTALALGNGQTYAVVPFSEFRSRSLGSLTDAAAALALPGAFGHSEAWPTGTRIVIPVRFLICAAFGNAAAIFIKQSSEGSSGNFVEGDPGLVDYPDAVLAVYRSRSLTREALERETKRCAEHTDANPGAKWLLGARIFLFFLHARRVSDPDAITRRIANGSANEFTIERVLYSYSFDTYGNYAIGAWASNLLPFLRPRAISDQRYLEAFR